MLRLTSIIRVSCLFAAASLAIAAPATWTLSGVTFADGGTASGSFAYDASTNTYSNINITTTAGTTFGTGATYAALNPGAASSATLLLAVPSGAVTTGTRLLAVGFPSALTNAGGTLSLIGSGSNETTCGNSGCTTAGGTARLVTAGSVTSTGSGTGTQPVPTLSNVALAVLAALLLGTSAMTLRRRAA